MVNRAEFLNSIKDMYANNPFMHLCGIRIAYLGWGEASVELRISELQHTNTNQKVHGGLLMTMMDNAAGLAGATIGKKVVTVSMTTDFLKTAGPNDLLEATALVVRAKEQQINMSMKVINKETQEELCIGSGVMLAVKDIPGFPAEQA